MEPLKTQVTENDKRLSVHEAVCAERYEGILNSFDKGSKRMQRIEYLLYAVIASVFFGKDMLFDVVKTMIGK
jgi:predicted nucleic acid-binding Zn ribbon protein